MKRHEGFIVFMREQGVVGLAVGFILGGAVSTVVKSLVDDVINPLLGLLLVKTDNLADAKWQIGEAEVIWGSLVSTFIDFIVIALVVYLGVKVLGLDRLDKKDS